MQHKGVGNVRMVRKVGQRIVIGDPENPIAVVKVDWVGSTKTELIVSAHTETPVNREEVAQRIVSERMRAREAV